MVSHITAVTNFGSVRDGVSISACVITGKVKINTAIKFIKNLFMVVVSYNFSSLARFLVNICILLIVGTTC